MDEMRMESGSVAAIVQGHERYAVRVHYHGGYGVVYHDSTELVDRTLDLELDWRPGTLGISEAVFVAAEDDAWDVVERWRQATQTDNRQDARVAM